MGNLNQTNRQQANLNNTTPNMNNNTVNAVMVPTQINADMSTVTINRITVTNTGRSLPELMDNPLHEIKAFLMENLPESAAFVLNQATKHFKIPVVFFDTQSYIRRFPESLREGKDLGAEDNFEIMEEADPYLEHIQNNH